MDDASARLVADVRTLLAGGEYTQALDRLKAGFHAQAGDLYNELILQESRYSRLRRDQRKGLLSNEEFNAQLNKLTSAMLELLNDFSRRQPAVTPVAVAVQAQVEVAPLVPHQILGINNLKQISWLEVGLRAARSVCRILGSSGTGTGFLVGRGLLMTNNHVIPDATVAARAQAEFDYQQAASGEFLPAVRYPLDPSRFHTSKALDYTLVGVVENPSLQPLSTWGTLRLNPSADPIPSEHVVIVQHPNGSYKQIVLTNNWIVSTQGPRLHYTTDTMPGSSGAPVFNDSWHVIAIHHGGGTLVPDPRLGHRYVNEGILMSAIKADAGAHWPQ